MVLMQGAVEGAGDVARGGAGREDGEGAGEEN